jgi:hypothetical protein
MGTKPRSLSKTKTLNNRTKTVDTLIAVCYIPLKAKGERKENRKGERKKGEN